MPVKATTPTARQIAIRDWVKNHVLTKGYGPTLREIGKHFGITSPNGVMCHVKALARHQAMWRAKNGKRYLTRAWIFPQEQST